MKMNVERSLECLAEETEIPEEELPQYQSFHNKSHMT
jgi:hypothetical protein